MGFLQWAEFPQCVHSYVRFGHRFIKLTIPELTHVMGIPMTWSTPEPDRFQLCAGNIHRESNVYYGMLQATVKAIDFILLHCMLDD